MCRTEPSSAPLLVAPSLYDGAAGTGGCWDYFFFFQQAFERGRAVLEVQARETCRRDDSAHGCVHLCRLVVEEEE